MGGTPPPPGTITAAVPPITAPHADASDEPSAAEREGEHARTARRAMSLPRKLPPKLPPRRRFAKNHTAENGTILSEDGKRIQFEVAGRVLEVPVWEGTFVPGMPRPMLNEIFDDATPEGDEAERARLATSAATSTWQRWPRSAPVADKPQAPKSALEYAPVASPPAAAASSSASHSPLTTDAAYASAKELMASFGFT